MPKLGHILGSKGTHGHRRSSLRRLFSAIIGRVEQHAIASHHELLLFLLFLLFVPLLLFFLLFLLFFVSDILGSLRVTAGCKSGRVREHPRTREWGFATIVKLAVLQ